MIDSEEKNIGKWRDIVSSKTLCTDNVYTTISSFSVRIKIRAKILVRVILNFINLTLSKVIPRTRELLEPQSYSKLLGIIFIGIAVIVYMQQLIV